MKKKVKPTHKVKSITRTKVLLASVTALIVLGSLAYWNVAQGGYLSQFFGQSADVNAVSGKQGCKAGCNGEYYQSWNSKKKICQKTRNPSKCGGKSTTKPSPTPSNSIQKKKNKECQVATVKKDCGDYKCKSNERWVQYEGEGEDCYSAKGKCVQDSNCERNSKSCIGKTKKGPCGGGLNCDSHSFPVYEYTNEACDSLKFIECITNTALCP